MAVQNINYGSYQSMTVTNLNSLANSATVGWQSARVDNQTSVKAMDYEIAIKLTMANTAPANDKAVYVYISPAMTTDGGTTWIHADGGTATLPSGTESAYTIASPNNLIQLGVLNYTTQNQIIQANLLLSASFGYGSIPDGFSIVIVDFTGAAVAATGNIVAYRAINNTIV